jgi:hypothetical protein
MEKVDLVVSDNRPSYPLKSTTGRPAPGGSFKFYTFPQMEEVEQVEPSSLEAESVPQESSANERQANTPCVGEGDGTGSILFRYFKSNVENYDK